MDEREAMGDLGCEIFDAVATTLETLSRKHWDHITDLGERDKARRTFGTALVTALAQQLGIAEALLILVDHQDAATVRLFRDMWIRVGHQDAGAELDKMHREQQEN